MRNILKAFLILVVGAAVGIFVELAPNMSSMASNYSALSIIRAWLYMLALYIWMAAPILLVTSLLMAFVLSRKK